MRRDKYNRALKQFPRGEFPAILKTVWAQIPDNLKKELTGRQLGQVLYLLDNSYCKGRASCGAEIFDGDSIWIDKLKCIYDLSDIAKLTPSNKKTIK